MIFSRLRCRGQFAGGVTKARRDMLKNRGLKIDYNLEAGEMGGRESENVICTANIWKIEKDPRSWSRRARLAEISWKLQILGSFCLPCSDDRDSFADHERHGGIYYA